MRVTPERMPITGGESWYNTKGNHELIRFVLNKKNLDHLYSYGLHTGCDRSWVMKSLQKLFDTLWKEDIYLSETGSLKLFLYKSFRNLLFSRLVDDHMFPTSSRKTGVSKTTSPDIKDPDQWLRLRLVSDLTNGTMTPEQNEIMYLKFHDKFTYHEIAEITSSQIDRVVDVIAASIGSIKQNR